ncbi:MAG: hypothetical protein JSR31_13320 [Nitrospira sp.]|nr:hypothetical protein [Nitrospira sp.]
MIAQLQHHRFTRRSASRSPTADTVRARYLLLRLYFELIGRRTALVSLLILFAKISNSQIPAVDMLLAW